MKGLTQKQRSILDFIGDFIEQHGMPPTIYEIAEHFDIAAPTASIHLKTLAKKNFINRSGKARGIFISAAYEKFRRKPKPNAVLVPLLKDLSAFAKIIKNDFIAEKYISVDPSLFNIREKEVFFAMKMPDMSMAQTGIQRDDILIFKNGLLPNAHDVVAAFSRGTTFIRLFMPIDDGKIVELSESGDKPKSATIPLKELKICGVFVGFLRPKIA